MKSSVPILFALLIVGSCNLIPKEEQPGVVLPKEVASNLFIEVTGSNNENIVPVDYPVTGNTADLTIPALPVIEVSVKRPGTSDPYDGAVMITASGTSDLIPGLSRDKESHFDGRSDGIYQLRVGAGSYTLTVKTDDRTFAQVSTTTKLKVSAEVPSAKVEIQLQTPKNLLQLTGQVVNSSSKMQPVVDSSVSATGVHGVTIQAFAANTRIALSERIQISTNQANAGAFTLPVAFSPGDTFDLHVSPDSVGSLLPTRIFTGYSPQNSSSFNAGILEFGEYGTPVRFTGRVVDSNNLPVPGAAYLLEVNYPNGTYRTTGTTNESGGISRDIYDQGTAKLTIVPPGESSAATKTVTSINVSPNPNDPNQGNQRNFGTISCSTRTLVRGKVTLKDMVDNMPLLMSNMKIQASPKEYAALGGLSLPSVETTPKADGSFQFWVDPVVSDSAVWVVTIVTPTKFYPTQGLILKLLPGSGPEVALPEVALEPGTLISGNINSSSSSIPFSSVSVNLYRVVQGSGATISVLIDTTISSSFGSYSLNAPVR